MVGSNAEIRILALFTPVSLVRRLRRSGIPLAAIPQPARETGSYLSGPGGKNIDKKAKKLTSPFLFYFSITVLTNLVFLAIVSSLSLILFHTIKVKSIIIYGLLIFLLFRIVIVSWMISKRFSVGQISNSRFIGIYFGRYFGLLIGGMLGYKIASGVWMLVGALAFYFVGRWIGSHVGHSINSLVERYYSIPDTHKLEIVTANRPKRSHFIYYVILPWLLVLAVVLFMIFDIRLSYVPELLPFARVIAILLSILIITFSWLAANGWLPNSLTARSLTELESVTLGRNLSILPVIFGFILYALGASLLEMVCFALASSFTAWYWYKRLKSPLLQ